MPPPNAHSRTNRSDASPPATSTSSATRSFFAAECLTYRYFVGQLIVRHMCAGGL